MKNIRSLLLGTAGLLALAPVVPAAAPGGSIWSHDNLFAWCAVPFDAKARGPEERAAMLEQLGFTMFAYDWRAKDVPTFDAEIEALQKHHVKLTAWWFPGSAADPTAKAILEACKRHDEHPQLWVANGGPLAKTPEEQKKKIEDMANQIKSLDALAKPYGCQVEIYSHNGWGGNEDNELAVVARLKEMGVNGVGLIYNFSHAHDSEHNDAVGFPELWKRIQPHVVAVNVAGMSAQGGEVYPSQGVSELAMMRTIQESGWHGPVGLIAEQGGDAAITLANCLKGLDWLAAEIKEGGAAGPKPTFKSSALTMVEPAAAEGSQLMMVANDSLNLVAGKFGKGLDATAGGLSVLNGKDDSRRAPITVECWAKLRDASNFNVLVASDPKSSGEHWEIYSYAGTGNFAAYLPGRSATTVPGEEVSTTAIADDTWHYLAMTLEKNRIRLYVDGKMVLDDPALQDPVLTPNAGNIAVGQTVEGDIHCGGVIDDARVSTGVLPIPEKPPTQPLTKDKSTLYLWNFDDDAKGS